MKPIFAPPLQNLNFDSSSIIEELEEDMRLKEQERRKAKRKEETRLAKLYLTEVPMNQRKHYPYFEWLDNYKEKQDEYNYHGALSSIIGNESAHSFWGDD